MNPNLSVLFALVIFHEVFFTTAIPIVFKNETAVVRADVSSARFARAPTKGQMKSVVLTARTKYKVKALSPSDQGMFSETYNIVDGFNGYAAILKDVNMAKGGKDVLSKTNKEVGYLKKIGLYMHSETDKAKYYYVVMRNVRKDYPKKGDALYKLLYEWYLENPSLKAKTMMAAALKTLYGQLNGYATTAPFLMAYEDYHMKNIFFNAKFSDAMPIDWGPQTDEFSGVVDMREAEKGYLTEYQDRMKTEIVYEMSVYRLRYLLLKAGKDLRREDIPDVESFYELNLRHYKIVATSRAGIYQIVGGLRGVDVRLQVMELRAGGDPTPILKRIRELKEARRYIEGEKVESDKKVQTYSFIYTV